MKMKDFLYGLLLCVCAVFINMTDAAAQTVEDVERLYVSNIVAWRNNTAFIPVCMDNTQDITAVQFVIGIPNGMSVAKNAFSLSERASDHIIKAAFAESDETHNWYLVMVYSPSNSPFEGDEGKIIDVQVSMSDRVKEGSVLTVPVADGIMCTADMRNIIQEMSAGHIFVEFDPESCVPSSATTITGELTGSVCLTECFADNVFEVNWKVTEASDFVSGYIAQGTGDMPAMQLVSTRRAQGKVVYSIVFRTVTSIVLESVYTIWVNPVPVACDNDLQWLRMMYESTDGTHWKTAWNVESDTIEGNWHGVTFDVNGNVTDISLASNGLAGTLKGNDTGLPYLRSMNLSDNYITSISPSFATGCPSLDDVDLSNNMITGLSGIIPASIQKLNLRNQFKRTGYESLSVQQLGVSEYMDNLQIGTLLSYSHPQGDFSARPDLSLYTLDGSIRIGRLSFGDDCYRLSLEGSYSLPDGADVKAVSASGIAEGSVLRLKLFFKSGDANMDDAVDVLDAQHTLNFILLRQSGLFNHSAADTYCDNLINVQDIVCTVNLFLDKVATDRVAFESTGGLKCESDAAEHKSDAQISVRGNELRLVSSDNVAALDITLQGVSPDELRLMLPRNDWNMITRATYAGTRLVLLSPSGRCLPSGDTVILQIPSGTAVISAEGADINASPVSVGIGGTTAVNTVDFFEETPAFDMSGRQTQGHSGDIVIKDGKKILVK